MVKKNQISIRIDNDIQDIINKCGISVSEFFREQIQKEFNSENYIKKRKQELKDELEKLEEFEKLEKKRLKAQEAEELKFIQETKEAYGRKPECIDVRTSIYNRLFRKSITSEELIKLTK